jgi:hypothetical protein
MANEQRRAARGVYRKKSGEPRAQREDQDTKAIERDLGRFATALGEVQEDPDASVNLDEPLAAVGKVLEEAPDRARLEARILARTAGQWELEDRAARAFLSGVLSAVVRALGTIAPERSADDQARFDAWDSARALGEQLLAFCASRGIRPTEWVEGSRFIDLLSDLDRVAMIEGLRDSGVTVGAHHLKITLRDACAIVGVSEDYTANVRRRHKKPVKKTG